jgi:nucleotide-binding universal stress UspA family protein
MMAHTGDWMMAARAGAAVVVGVDGSPRSLDAVEMAATEAALRHRPLRVVHAVPAWRAGTTTTGPRIGVGDDYLAEAVRLAGKVSSTIPVTSDLVPGRAVPVLVHESRRANLVVLGDRGLSGLLIGSVVVQTAAHAACPVLIVRGLQYDRSGPVVVGVDGSARSMLALEFAAEEASLRGAELVALHAWDSRSMTELTDTPPQRREYWSGHEDEQRVLAEALAGVADRYPDVAIGRSVIRGSARVLLTERSRTAQLVVVGDRGSGGFAGLALGSVSQHLIYHAGCPTAVVRRG